MNPIQSQNSGQSIQHNTTIQFTKMHGLGNDFMVIDQVNQAPIALTADTIRTLSDRHFGIGFDQLLIVAPPSTEAADFDYIIYNADGNEVEQCGNGARCFSEFVFQKGLSKKNELTVNTRNGIIKPKRVGNGNVRVDMGTPKFNPSSLPFTPPDSNLNVQNNEITYTLRLPDNKEISIGALSMGNPHAVILTDTIDNKMVSTLGPMIEKHKLFPNQVNVGFVEVINQDRVKIRVHERGVGETKACGTGACAGVVYAQTQGQLNSKVTAELLGGELIIEWDGKAEDHVFIEGPATLVYDGTITLPIPEQSRK